MTQWKPVPEFEGHYEVSDRGEVISLKRPLTLSEFWRGGYRCVSLRRPGVQKIRAVHTLVLGAFIGPRPPKFHGAHLDGNVENNALNNLRWVPQSENEGHKSLHGTDRKGERSPHARLTNEKAAVVREIVAAGVGVSKVCLLLDMSEANIYRMLAGKSYRGA
jgi:hypothetical protein